MSYAKSIVEDTPDKYESIIETRIYSRLLNFRLKEYNALQNEYNILMKKYINNMKNITSEINDDFWKIINNILDRMEKVNDKIKELVNKQKDYGSGYDKVDKMFQKEIGETNISMDNMIEDLKRKRLEINALLKKPSHIAEEEDANIRQISNYSIYGFWILILITSIYLIFNVYFSNDEEISLFTYVFIIIWILFLLAYYYRILKKYTGTGLDYIANKLADY
jgi:hypothetical protein